MKCECRSSEKRLLQEIDRSNSTRVMNASRRTGRQLDRVYSFQMTGYVVKQASARILNGSAIAKRTTDKARRRALKGTVGAKLVTKLA